MSTFVLLDDGHTSFMATPDEYRQPGFIDEAHTAIAVMHGFNERYGPRLVALVVFDHDARV